MRSDVVPHVDSANLMTFSFKYARISGVSTLYFAPMPSSAVAASPCSLAMALKMDAIVAYTASSSESSPASIASSMSSGVSGSSSRNTNAADFAGASGGASAGGGMLPPSRPAEPIINSACSRDRLNNTINCPMPESRGNPPLAGPSTTAWTIADAAAICAPLSAVSWVFSITRPLAASAGASPSVGSCAGATLTPPIPSAGVMRNSSAPSFGS